jgi:hypothetical protein
MLETAMTLKAWESFYVIVGSSAGALIGLQFVVITIIAESRMRSTGHELAAFGTPTVLHFVAVLLIAAIISAPWPSLALPSFAIGLSGAFGLVYEGVVLHDGARRLDLAHRSAVCRIRALHRDPQRLGYDDMGADGSGAATAGRH